jgi:hypothetical protein
MTTLQLTQRQAECLSDFTAERGHEGPVRLTVDPNNMSGRVIRAELLEGSTVIARRLLHPHGSYTP